ncbi:MAG: hypothetical protein M1336_07020 [Deltaproteobacteria bacterium]|jgi:hypothetical protein|nr:hypothetical protein [Deltaproteobacteria bacterium]
MRVAPNPTADRPTTGVAERRPLAGLLSFMALFTSLGTLVCCALPLVLVVLGLGASAGVLFARAPWLVALSAHKVWTFSVTGALIAANFVYVYALAPRFKACGAGCAIDGPDACAGASLLSRVVLWLSAGIYAVGFTTAYLLPWFLGD